MSLASPLEAVAGLLLVFFVPGYAVTRALFPEWRLVRPSVLRRLVEILTLSFVLSIVLTVLIGYLLLAVAPGGFRAFWTDPTLEVALLAVTVTAFAAAAVRGAFGAVPVTPHTVKGAEAEEGAWELSLELDRLGREERRILRALRGASRTPDEESDLQERLRTVRARSLDLAREREARYGE
jgi:uncharacterized membrane protein